MAEVLLFHHALGLTQGVVAFADGLRAEGHTVHTPDLFEGRTFTDLFDGIDYVDELGYDTIVDQSRRIAFRLRGDIVYAGLSLGVMPAQALAQTRPGAVGAVLLHGCVPPEEFGGPWPARVPVQIHTMADDEWGDVDIARDLAETAPAAELFVYPGEAHLFTDATTPDHDPDAAALVMQRVLEFLARVGRLRAL